MNTSYRHNLISLLVCLLCLAYGCSEDDEKQLRPKEQVLIYMHGDHHKNQVHRSVPLFRNGETLIGDTIPLVHIQSTRAVPSTQQVAIEYTGNQEAIEEYKLETGDSLSLLSTEAFTIIANQFTLEEGDNKSSEPISIVLSGDFASHVEPDEKYLLPISISEKNRSSFFSSNRRKIYGIISFPKLSASVQPSSNTIDILSPPSGDSEIKPPIVNLSVNLEQKLLTEHTFTLEVDNSLVDEFNQQNNTSFNELPADTYDVDESIQIPAGSLTSTAEFLLTNVDELENGKEFIVPIRISEDSGALYLSDEDHQIVFLKISKRFQNVMVADPSSNGQEIERSTWTMQGTTSFGATRNLIDDQYESYWAAFHNAPELIININEEKKLNGLKLSPLYLNGSVLANYVPSTMEIYSSSDGVNWQFQGLYSSPPVSGTPAQPDFFNIKFIEPVEASMIRFEFPPTTAGLSEVFIFETSD